MSENNKELMKICFLYMFTDEGTHETNSYRIYSDDNVFILEHSRITVEDKNEHVETFEKTIEDEDRIKSFLKDIKKMTRFWSENYTNDASHALWYLPQGYSWGLKCVKPLIICQGRNNKPKNFDEVTNLIYTLFERG